MGNIIILRKEKKSYDFSGLLTEGQIFIDIVPANAKNARQALKKRHTSICGCLSRWLKENGHDFRVKTYSAERDGVYGFLIVKKN